MTPERSAMLIEALDQFVQNGDDAEASDVVVVEYRGRSWDRQFTSWFPNEAIATMTANRAFGWPTTREGVVSADVNAGSSNRTAGAILLLCLAACETWRDPADCRFIASRYGGCSYCPNTGFSCER